MTRLRGRLNPFSATVALLSPIALPASKKGPSYLRWQNAILRATSLFRECLESIVWCDKACKYAIMHTPVIPGLAVGKAGKLIDDIKSSDHSTNNKVGPVQVRRRCPSDHEASSIGRLPSLHLRAMHAKGQCITFHHHDVVDFQIPQRTLDILYIPLCEIHHASFIFNYLFMPTFQVYLSLFVSKLIPEWWPTFLLWRLTSPESACDIW